MKIISFALFGPDAKYRRGMLDNVRARDDFYPDWEIFIYCDRLNHDALMHENLGKHVRCILQQDISSGVEGMSWRFLAVLEPCAEVVLFRDADSIFTSREVSAVTQWLDSDRNTHIIRDHPYHVSPIMGGLLGVRGAALRLLASLVKQRMDRHRLTEYGDDQVFLSQDFYPKVRSTALVHTNCIRIWPEFTQPLPPDRPGDNFIGAYAFLTTDENGVYDAVRLNEPPKTLLPTHWERHPVWRHIYAKVHGKVNRLKHGCKWCI